MRSIAGFSGARLLATLALAVNLLVHLSPLWMPAVERAGIEVCTAYGLTVIPGGTAVPGSTHDQQQRLKTCPFCTVHAAVLLVPTTPPLPLVRSRLVAPQPPGRSETHAALSAGFNHLSRAPPSIA